MEYKFSDFKRWEAQAWVQSGCESEPESSLLIPSGSLEATLAHRLNQPSLTTTLRTGTGTADRSNECIAMVMGNVYRENKTLTYDHLHRRSKKSDGLERFPEKVVECHEHTTQKIVELSHVTVEVPYGRHIQARVLQSGLQLTAIPLWDSFTNIVLYFVHEDNFENEQPGHQFRKIILFATHPQRTFYEPKDGEIAFRQDRILEVAVQIIDATINFQADYYQNKRWQECVPSINELAQYRAAKLYETFFFEDLPKVRQVSQGSDTAPQQRHSGRWDEIFSSASHKNEAIRKIHNEAIRAAEVLDQESPKNLQDPAGLPPAVLKWLKGQKFFFTMDQSTAKVISQSLLINARNFFHGPIIEKLNAAFQDNIYGRCSDN